MAKVAAKSGMKNKPREDEDEGADDEDDEPVKSKASAVKAKAKGKATDDEDDEEEAEESESETEEDEDDAPKAKKAKKDKKAAADDDDDDSAGEGDDDVIDLSAADENAVGKVEVIPRGKYHCTVAGTEFVEFKTGSKGMKIKLEIAKGEYAAGKTRKRGKTLYTNLVMSANAADLLKAGLKAIGVSKKIYNSDGFSTRMLQKIADSGDLLGNEVIADVQVGTYNGDKNNNVRRLIHPSAMEEVAEGKGGFLDD